MNYSLACQINNDPVFSGLLSPCPTYRFLGVKRTHHFDILAVCLHCSGHVAPCWGKLVVILRIVSGKIGTLNGALQNNKLDLKWAHMINMAVLLKWNVANGGGEGLKGIRRDGGWGVVCGVLPWLLRAWACLDGTAHPLPLRLCSCVTHCLPACNFPSTVTVWAHRHPGNF